MYRIFVQVNKSGSASARAEVNSHLFGFAFGIHKPQMVLGAIGPFDGGLIIPEHQTFSYVYAPDDQQGTVGHIPWKGGALAH